MKPVYLPESEPRVADLHMENDLLAHENRILRARLEGYGSAEASAGEDAADRRVSTGREEEFRQAYHDLRWFVRRLDESPVGFILRRWRGFQVLVERYGRSAE